MQPIYQHDRHSRQQVATELDNVRAALRWSLDDGERELGAQLGAALGWFWYHQGYWHEGRSWHHQVRVRLAGGPPTSAYAHNMFCEGHLAQFQGDVVTARR